LEFGTELVPAADGSLVARVVAAAERAPASHLNALAYPTAPQSPSGRKSKFPTLPNKISSALAAAGSDFHDNARWER
jgi:hypothetical protein